MNITTSIIADLDRSQGGILTEFDKLWFLLFLWNWLVCLDFEYFDPNSIEFAMDDWTGGWSTDLQREIELWK